jgi:hypothetical protein
MLTWSVQCHSAAAVMPAAHYVLLPVMQLVGEEGGPEVGQKVDREDLADQAAWEVQAGQGAPVHWTSAVIYVEFATQTQ